MAESVFLELSIVIAVSAFVAIFMRMLKQPLIIGYILSGIIVGPMVLGIVSSSSILELFSEMGIALLIFIVGLNLDFSTLKRLGPVSLATGIGQVVFTFVVGYFIAMALGFSTMAAVYISIALTFSSTIIIIKILSDKQDLDSLYGKISIGLLLVQDFIAIIILLFLSTPLDGKTYIGVFMETLLKVTSISLLLFLISVGIMPKILKFVAKSQELLFIFGISWVLVLSALLSKLGFSTDIGALMAGISLASSPYHFEISSKLRPLRDFFIILFFIVLGSKLVFTPTSGFMISIIVFSLFILIGNPLIVMAIMGIMGYKKRVGFFTGLTVAQISEFSLILVIIGMKLGHLTQEIVSMVTVVGLLTIAGSTYMIIYNEKLYNLMAPYLGIFERKNAKNSYVPSSMQSYDIVLFGYNRIGFSLLKSFKKIKKSFVVVDYNPDVIDQLRHENMPYKYGDASDIELLDELSLDKVKLAISTIPQLDTNLLLLEKIKSANPKAITIMTSHQIDEAFKLYEHGADYVIMPHFLGGEYAAALIEKSGTSMTHFVREKMAHMHDLNMRKMFGHEHPIHNRK